MRKSIISFTCALTLAALAASPAMAAEPAKAPTNTAECMGLLYSLSHLAESGTVKEEILESTKLQAQKMAELCQANKLEEAFTTYSEISKAMQSSK